MTAAQLRRNLEEAAKNPPRADAEFVNRAVADIPKLCTFLERRLKLSEKTPLEFEKNWLTSEGLAASRPESAEFYEPGSWSVFLAQDPEKYSSTFQKTSPLDRSLEMGIGMFAHDALFVELGADWGQQERIGGAGLVLREFPLMSRLSDISADAVYEPGEIDALLIEYERAGSMVKNSKAIRGLDNLIRIAKWAKKFNLGIYFGGQ